MKEMNKKAQVEVFIILAIVIIVIVVLFFVFRDKVGFDSVDNADETEMIELINTCIEISLIDGARLIGLQGGYLRLPQRFVELNLSKIAYGYYLGENVLNSKSRIEDEIADYMELILPYCFDESLFLDYSITEGDVTSKININKESISTSTKFPIGATKGDSSFTINKNFEVTVPINMGPIYDVVDKIIEKEIENPDEIELTYFADLDYGVSIIPYNEEIIIYSISDENPMNPDYHYTFMFANKLK